MLVLSRIGDASEGMKNLLKSEVNNTKSERAMPSGMQNALVSSFQEILSHP